MGGSVKSSVDGLGYQKSVDNLYGKQKKGDGARLVFFLSPSPFLAFRRLVCGLLIEHMYLCLVLKDVLLSVSVCLCRGMKEVLRLEVYLPLFLLVFFHFGSWQ